MRRSPGCSAFLFDEPAEDALGADVETALVLDGWSARSGASCGVPGYAVIEAYHHVVLNVFGSALRAKVTAMLARRSAKPQ